jgi:hypothetical protein
MSITALPTPPSRQDPTNFNDRADTFLSALPLFQTEANALQENVNQKEESAVAASASALSVVNIVKWVSGTTYENGAAVWSPINGLAYRRIAASGSGTTDPSSDTTNYKQISGTGDVSTSGNQTITGTKTFTSTISGNISGNAATATNATNATNASVSSQVVVNYNNDSNGTYALLWGSGNSIYATGGIFCNPGLDTIYASEVQATSDERLKTNWRELPVDFVEKLSKVKSGIYDRTDIPMTQAGSSAQDWQKLLPEVVSENENGMLSLAYANAALVSAIALAKEVEMLKEKIKQLENQL